MIRGALTILAFIALLFVSGCGSGTQSAGDDDWFRENNERFDRQYADHMKKSSEAVRDYKDYRNR